MPKKQPFYWKHLVLNSLFQIVEIFKKQFIEHFVDVLMESKGGKKKSSSSSSMYEAPLGYKIEDVRPAGGIKKFQSAAYSNCARKPS
uniref:Uncharacterized protein n=1 Tax=Oryza meridionalis TaxID=40149 RepID=A0A0E0ESE4_9ORYZ